MISFNPPRYHHNPHRHLGYGVHTYPTPFAGAKLLLEAGAKLDVIDKKGQQPLHWAASQGKSEVAQLQIAAGAKIDALNSDGLSPQALAAKAGHAALAESLGVG